LGGIKSGSETFSNSLSGAPSGIPETLPGISSEPLGNPTGGIPIQQRFQEYLERLNSSPPADSADSALQQLRYYLEQVEDELSGIPKKSPPPTPNMPDGRMYPPLEDYIRRNSDGTISARSKGHNISIGADGSITITDRKTGEIVLNKPGAGQ
jgi:hypothetical protein